MNGHLGDNALALVVLGLKPELVHVEVVVPTVAEEVVVVLARVVNQHLKLNHAILAHAPTGATGPLGALAR